MADTNDLMAIKALLDRGDYKEALEGIFTHLEYDMDNSRLLYMAGVIFGRLKRWGAAYQFYERARSMSPERPEIYNSIGMVYQNLNNFKKAEKFFRKALDKYPKDHAESDAVLNNLALLSVNQCRFDDAMKWSEKCLDLNPNMLEARESMAMAQLARKEWREGWVNYESMLGIHKQRLERTYCEPEEPRWDGALGKVVVIYGEQGLGDEIYFSSCIPDALRDCRQLIVDCDHRLEGLFRRSFPGAIIYGTRFERYVNWAHKYPIDARCSIGTLPKFYRNEEKDFPGEPWIKTDPMRVLQWDALLKKIGNGPRIGLAWTGGNRHTGEERRSVKLDDLAPILKAVPDAVFVSLQYKGNTQQECDDFEAIHGIKVHHWDRATKQGCDADETAALIDSLDLVVTVTTTTAHLCGAIGKKAFVLVPERPRWLYHEKGDKMPWYGDTVTLFRQSRITHDWPIDEVRDAVKKEFAHRLIRVVSR